MAMFEWLDLLKELEQAQESAISERSVRQILHKDLKFHLYKLMIVQELHEEDARHSSKNTMMRLYW